MIFKKSILVLRTVDSGFHYKLDSGFQGLDSGSRALDSGFQRLKFRGFRIPDSLTWGYVNGNDNASEMII